MRSTTPRSMESLSILQVMLAWADQPGELANAGPGPVGDNSAKTTRSTAARPVNLADLVKCGECGESGRSAKLESCLVDAQRLDAMVERGWRNPKFRGGPRRPGDTPPALGKRRLDHLAFASRLPRARSPEAGRRRTRDRPCGQPGLVDREDVVGAQDDGPLDHVLQLTDIPRPVVRLQQVERLLLDRANRFACPG